MQKKRSFLTVEAAEVAPVQQGAVEEQLGAVGRVPDRVGEQVHLQQGLDQVAQHLGSQVGPPQSPPPLLSDFMC